MSSYQRREKQCLPQMRSRIGHTSTGYCWYFCLRSPIFSWLRGRANRRSIGLHFAWYARGYKCLAHIMFKILQGMTRLISVFCETMGPVCVEKFIHPYFAKEVQGIVCFIRHANPNTGNSAGIKKSAVMQVYAVGVLPFLGQKRLLSTLREIIVNMALGEEGWEEAHLPLLGDCLPLYRYEVCYQDPI